MIISFLNQKGGVGKSTLCVNLARFFTKNGHKTLVIDSDPQGSCIDWHERSKGELLEVHCIFKPTIEKDIRKFKPYYDFILIDGIPSVSEITIATIRCSDYVLIPVQPSPYDIWSAGEIVELVKTFQSVNRGLPKTAFIVSRRIVNTNLGRDVHDSLQGYEIPVLKNGTCQRVIYPHSANVGLTVLDMGHEAKEAACEIEEIAKEIIELSKVPYSNKKT